MRSTSCSRNRPGDPTSHWIIQPRTERHSEDRGVPTVVTTCNVTAAGQQSIQNCLQAIRTESDQAFEKSGCDCGVARVRPIQGFTQTVFMGNFQNNQKQFRRGDGRISMATFRAIDAALGVGRGTVNRWPCIQGMWLTRCLKTTIEIDCETELQCSSSSHGFVGGKGFTFSNRARYNFKVPVELDLFDYAGKMPSSPRLIGTTHQDRALVASSPPWPPRPPRPETPPSQARREGGSVDPIDYLPDLDIETFRRLMNEPQPLLPQRLESESLWTAVRQPTWVVGGDCPGCRLR